MHRCNVDWPLMLPLTHRIFISLTLAGVLPGIAAAQETPAVGGSNVRIETPWMRATPAGATVAGGYVTLTNTGKQTDRLIGATAAAAKSVEVHMMTNDMGVMKMRHMTDGVELPPGTTVELKPGGIHLMLLGLREGLTAGASIAGTLTFAKAGTVSVTFTVVPLGADAPADAAGHDHRHH
jgi:copper(I)-binding protein